MDSFPSQTSPFHEKQRRRHIVTISIAVGVILLGVLSVALYLRSQKTGILVLDPTTDIVIKLNGRTTVPQQTDRGLYLPVYAGQYRIELDKTGYLPFVQDIKTTAGTILNIRPAFTLTPTVQEATGDSLDFVRPSANEKSIYYLGDYRQRLFRLEVSNQTTVPLTDNPLTRVVDVEWGSDPDVALIVQTDGTYLHEIPRFDFQNQIYVKIGGPEIVSPMWDPNNPDRIAAAYFPSSGEQSLVVADQRFTAITRLASLQGIPSPKILWSPNSDYILLMGRSADPAQENLWLYTLASGQVQQLTQGGSVHNALFSPDSTRILFETQDSQGKTSQSLLTLNGDTVQPLNDTLPLTQVAWKNATSYYEVSADHQSLILHNLDGTQETTSLSLGSTEAIQTLFYYAQPSKVIITTKGAVYTVNLEKN